MASSVWASVVYYGMFLAILAIVLLFVEFQLVSQQKQIEALRMQSIDKRVSDFSKRHKLGLLKSKTEDSSDSSSK